MKSAILASALIAFASVATADDAISLISSSPAGAGAFEVVSKEDGVFTLSRITCVPMMAGVLDTDDEIGDLNGSGTADMIEVERGTTEHAIATYACGS
ncbi:MAG: hypothetical protein AAFQ64_07390 [Pseudomonadota bacterium]